MTIILRKFNSEQFNKLWNLDDEMLIICITPYGIFEKFNLKPSPTSVGKWNNN